GSRARLARHAAGRRLLRRGPGQGRRPPGYQRPDPPFAGGGGVRIMFTRRRGDAETVAPSAQLSKVQRRQVLRAGYEKLSLSASPRFRVIPLLGALLALPTPVQADTLIDNVNGITVDRTGTVTRFEAMLIDDEGKIAQLV